MSETYNQTLENEKESVKYHSMLLRALIPFVPKTERNHAYAWQSKLSRLEGTPAQLKNQAEYLWLFIMEATQGSEMMPLFMLPPPEGELAPLCDVVDKEIYTEILNCSDRKNWWKPESLVEGMNDEDLEDDDQPWVCGPEEFIRAQPMPTGNGTYLYGCVFAPHE